MVGYIRLPWQRAIPYKPFKVHPGPGPETATQLLNLAHKYRPETMQEKKLRLLDRARKKAGGKGDVPSERPPVLQVESIQSPH